MFVENYRLDTMIGGQAQTVIPYPKISDEDWRKWKAFLPVRSELLCKKVLLHKSKTFVETVYGIPRDGAYYRKTSRPPGLSQRRAAEKPSPSTCSG